MFYIMENSLMFPYFANIVKTKIFDIKLVIFKIH